MVYEGSSNLQSCRVNDIEPWKSSMPPSSWNTSFNPEVVLTSVRPSATAALDPLPPARVPDQPVVALPLEGQQVGEVEGFLDPGE